MESAPLRPEIKVFYQLHDGVLITENWFYVDHLRYAVADLDDLAECTGQIQPARRAALEVIGVEAALVLAVVTLVTLINGPSTLLYALGALDLAVALALIGASGVRWPRPHQLRARYRGHDLVIYSATDAIEFGKVARAASRAVLYHRGEYYPGEGD